MILVDSDNLGSSGDCGIVCDSVVIGGGVELWVLLSSGMWEGVLRCCGGDIHFYNLSVMIVMGLLVVVDLVLFVLNGVVAVCSVIVDYAGCVVVPNGVGGVGGGVVRKPALRVHNLCCGWG